MIRHLESGVEGVPLFLNIFFKFFILPCGVGILGFSSLFMVLVFFFSNAGTAPERPNCKRVTSVSSLFFFSSAAFWLEAFSHVKLIGAVHKRWNAAELAHGLFFLWLARDE